MTSVLGTYDLEGWKEISDFCGRSTRTVRRWAAVHGMPVKRLFGRVVANREMLREWFETSGALA